MRRIEISENGVNIAFGTDGRNRTGLLHLSALPFDERALGGRDDFGAFPLFELQTSENAPEPSFVFADYRDSLDACGRLITIVQKDEALSLTAETVFRFFSGLPAVQVYTRVTNGGAALGAGFLSGFCMTFAACPVMYVVDPASEHVCRPCDTDTHGISMGMLRSRETGACLVWQQDGMKMNGSLVNACGMHRLRLSASPAAGTLESGESITSDVCTLAAAAPENGFDGTFETLTRLRRISPKVRRSHDLRDMPVLFDSGSCPAEDLPRLAEAAGNSGCRYFIVSADSLTAELSEVIRKNKMLPAARLDISGADAEAVRSSLSLLPKTNLLYLTGCPSPMPGDIIELLSEGERIIAADAPLACADIPCALWAVEERYAACARLAVLPEQLLVRCEIHGNGTPEQTAAALNRGMLSRICVCGRIDRLSPESFAVVKERLSVYKGLRADIREGIPLLVPPLPSESAGADAAGIRSQDGTRAYLSAAGSPSISCHSCVAGERKKESSDL